VLFHRLLVIALRVAVEVIRALAGTFSDGLKVSEMRLRLQVIFPFMRSIFLGQIACFDAYLAVLAPRYLPN